MIREVKFSKGDVIFETGEIADTLYVLDKGQIDVIQKGNKKHAINIPGSFFGEMSFLTGRIRTAKFVAATDVKVYEVGYRDRAKNFDIDVNLLIKLARNMATRLDLIEEQVTEQVPYQMFHEKIKEHAKQNKDLKLSETIASLENEINTQQMATKSALIKEALNLCLIEQPFLESIQEILLFHIPPESKCKKNVSEAELLKSIKENKFYASEIKFKGDAQGHINLFLNESLANSFASSFIGIDSLNEELVQSGVMELSNEILGRLANKINGVNIRLECPTGIKGDQLMLEQIKNKTNTNYYIEHKHGHLIATATLL